MAKDSRYWDGKTVHLTKIIRTDRRSVDVALTPATAGDLANALRKLHQIAPPLSDGLTELAAALDYVLVADPASVAAHRIMEAGRGMTPDGGYRPPDGIQHRYIGNAEHPGFCHYASETHANSICWQPPAAHYGEANGEREVSP